MFDDFWDFNRMVKDGVPRQSRDHRISPFLWVFGVFSVYVTGMGCQPMGSPIFRPLFVMYK
jgi:hypothetical protein